MRDFCRYVLYPYDEILWREKSYANITRTYMYVYFHKYCRYWIFLRVLPWNIRAFDICRRAHSCKSDENTEQFRKLDTQIVLLWYYAYAGDGTCRREYWALNSTILSQPGYEKKKGEHKCSEKKKHQMLCLVCVDRLSLHKSVWHSGRFGQVLCVLYTRSVCYNLVFFLCVLIKPGAYFFFVPEWNYWLFMLMPT